LIDLGGVAPASLHQNVWLGTNENCQFYQCEVGKPTEKNGVTGVRPRAYPSLALLLPLRVAAPLAVLLSITIASIIVIQASTGLLMEGVTLEVTKLPKAGNRKAGKLFRHGEPRRKWHTRKLGILTATPATPASSLTLARP
jgi:hypothetical protein